MSSFSTRLLPFLFTGARLRRLRASMSKGVRNSRIPPAERENAASVHAEPLRMRGAENARR